MSLKDRLTSVFDVFSRRGAARAPRGTAYKPDQISERLRNRIVILYRDVMSGQWPTNGWATSENRTGEFWQQVHNALEHLHGRVRLAPNVETNSLIEDAHAFVQHCSAEEFFDFLELSFRTDCMWRVVHERNQLVDAINEIFRVENAPYHLTPVVTREEPDTASNRRSITIHTVAWPRVIRAEDEVTFSEAIAPALSVLAAPHFEAASLEFRDALDEYRKGHYGDCMTKCGSAFESVLKVLCKRNGWPFDEKRDMAKTLLTLVLGKSSLDPFFEQPLMLIATMRNRLSSAHGGGAAVRTVERHVAQYAITSTAAAVILLVHEVGA
jgi:hypothetical protein